MGQSCSSETSCFALKFTGLPKENAPKSAGMTVTPVFTKNESATLKTAALTLKNKPLTPAAQVSAEGKSPTPPGTDFTGAKSPTSYAPVSSEAKPTTPSPSALESKVAARAKSPTSSTNPLKNGPLRNAYRIQSFDAEDYDDPVRVQARAKSVERMASKLRQRREQMISDAAEYDNVIHKSDEQIRNLKARFPYKTEGQVRDALKLALGHAGAAARFLRGVSPGRVRAWQEVQKHLGDSEEDMYMSPIAGA